MNKKEFDYYIFIDYSEDIIGFIIVESAKIKEILLKISKLHHYKEVKHDKAYLLAIRKRFEKDKIIASLLKYRIKEVKINIDLFAEIIEFLRKNEMAKIFVSIDDNFYVSFLKFINALEQKNNLFVVRESKLRKHSIEYKLNLIIDNLLTLERRKRKNE